jgi:phage terminase large subunit-like protein
VNADDLRSLTPADRSALLSTLSEAEASALMFDWRFWARPDQVCPWDASWIVWLMMAGRGWGKTRTGAEAVREAVEKGYRRIALVGKSAADVRDVMVEGESGILSVFPPHLRPSYEPTKRRVTFANGAIATAYSSKEPDQLRGPQSDFAWADEPAAWFYPTETWDMLMMGLRLGSDPRCIATTTPKPIGLVRRLLDAPTTHLTRGTTYDNAANLAPAFYQTIIQTYEGTVLGRQELYAEMLTEIPGALWKRESIHRGERPSDLVRVVVAIDPAVSDVDGSAETGIMVVGLGRDMKGYLLADLSLRGSPDEWGRAAVKAYEDYSADLVIGERNNGGDMIAHVIRTVDKTVNFKAVFASRGKQTRAEPVSALYEQGRVVHCGAFEALEDQLCTWVPGKGTSPDRLDALVWGLTEVMLGKVRRFSAPVPKPRGY